MESMLLRKVTVDGEVRASREIVDGLGYALDLLRKTPWGSKVTVQAEFRSKQHVNGGVVIVSLEGPQNVIGFLRYHADQQIGRISNR